MSLHRPDITDQDVLDAVAKYPTRVEAAVSLGITRNTLMTRLRRATGGKVPDGRKVKREPGDESSLLGGDAEVAGSVVDTAALRTLLRTGPLSLNEIAKKLELTRGEALDGIDQLQQQGYNLHEHSGKWHWSKTPTPGHKNTDLPIHMSDKDGWISFGFTSDNHLCSKYERLDVLNDLYDKFAEEGVQRVYNAGNWIDGEASFNMHDLHVHGVQAQLRYLAKHYPQRKGIVTHAVSGDDHEGWYAQKSGMDIGRMALTAMQDAGRTDWVDMGYMEAFVSLVHAGSGNDVKLHLMHPGGGSAYAVSYTVQKIVEGYDGGDKPAVLLAGHYHKLAYGLIRNVHTIQTGCTQDQTPFARKKKLSFHLGGGIAKVKLDEETGAVTRCKLEFFNYFVKGYYNNRWSHSGGVTLPERGVA
jgi:biotin operon repressor